MRIAYADPPYPGQAKRLYGNHPDYAGEVDHAELIERLERDYDGWALSTSVPALQQLLPLCPKLGRRHRIASWHRSPRVLAPSNVGWTWEPVIFKIARIEDRQYVPDTFHVPQGLGPEIIGAKPPFFIRWVFRLIGAEPTDTFDDLFPGSGVVGREWQRFATQTRLAI